MAYPIKGFGRAQSSVLTLKTDDAGILRISVCNKTKAALAKAFGSMSYIADDETATIARAKTLLANILGPWGVEVLMNVGNGALGNGVVVLSNLPFEKVEWSPVPGAPARSAKSSDLSELLLLAFGAYFGEPYGVKNEGDRLVNDLIPSRADLYRHTGNGSRQTLGLHAENAALKYVQKGRDWSPKGLLLTGVSHQNVGGPTTPVALARAAVALLNEKDKRVLRSEGMDIAVPERQRDAFAGGDTVGPVPVILGKPGRESIFAAFYGDMMRPGTKDAERALKRLEKAVNAVAVHLEVLPGHIVYVANGPALHGRSQFEPEFDQYNRARRWIQRIFVTGRLDELRDADAVSDRVFRIGN